MARLPRLTVADLPHQVIQRGNNGQPIVIDAADRERLLGLIGEQAPRFGVSLHGYTLLQNQFQLLATPASADGLPKFMQAVGRSYVRWFNDRHGRTGTLWEGRYRSTVLQPDRYLLACMAAIDWRAVASGEAPDVGSFPWSSHAHYAGSRHDRFLTPHALYWQLGNTPFAREAAYVDLVRAGVPASVDALLTEATLRGWAAGDDDFVSVLQDSTERRVQKSRAGRPAIRNKT